MGTQTGYDQLVVAKGDKSAARMRRLLVQIQKADADRPSGETGITSSSWKFTWPVWPGAIFGLFVLAVLSDSLNGWGAFWAVAAAIVFGWLPWVLLANSITYVQRLYFMSWRHFAMKPGRERLIRVDDAIWSQLVSLLEARGSEESAHAFVARHLTFFRDSILDAYEEREAYLEEPEETRDSEMVTYLWTYITRSLAALLDDEERAAQAVKDRRQSNLRQRFPLPPTDTAEANTDATSDASSIDMSK